MPKSSRAITKGLRESEPNPKAKRRTKGNKLEQELNSAMSLVKHDESIQEPSISHAGTRALMKYNAERNAIDLEPTKKISIDKHVESTRYKIAYVVDKLADELMREASKKTKKNKEHLKGITWAFGTLYDKLSVVSSDAQVVALPSKLLANVTEMLKAQTELIKASQLSSSPQGQEAKTNTLENETLETSTDDKATYVVVPAENQSTTGDYVSNNDVRSSPSVASTEEKVPT